MSWWKRSVAAASALALLSGCATGGEQTGKPLRQSKRVSPAPVEAPTLPPGTFDQAKERSELAAAQAARQAGDASKARQLAEEATNHWPGDAAAWDELKTDCQATGDTECADYAAFFRAKIDYVKPLPAKAAQLGFQSLAEEPAGPKSEGFTYDERTVETARRLWAFYHLQDTARASLDKPVDEETFSEKYPYAPALLVIGIGAGVLTGIKSLADR